MEGWVHSTFEGATHQVTLPVAACADDRIVGVWCPDGPSVVGMALLDATLRQMRGRGEDAQVKWQMEDDAWGDDAFKPSVYRIRVGARGIAGWVDIGIADMANRICYDGEKITLVLHHPDTILHRGGDGAREMKREAVDACREYGMVVRGERSALDAMARDCVKCAVEGRRNMNVTEIDGNGLGLCREHEGWDVRPETTRWVQEGLGL